MQTQQVAHRQALSFLLELQEDNPAIVIWRPTFLYLTVLYFSEFTPAFAGFDELQYYDLPCTEYELETC